MRVLRGAGLDRLACAAGTVCALASCSPPYVQQPVAQPDPAPTVAVLEPAPGYWAAERRYEAVELCTMATRARSATMVAAGNGMRDTVELARELCWQPGVSAPFERLLAGGLKQDLERAAEEAERVAKERCSR